jgi:hypothetical protein
MLSVASAGVLYRDKNFKCEENVWRRSGEQQRKVENVRRKS